MGSLSYDAPVVIRSFPIRQTRIGDKILCVMQFVAFNRHPHMWELLLLKIIFKETILSDPVIYLGVFRKTGVHFSDRALTR